MREKSPVKDHLCGNMVLGRFLHSSSPERTEMGQRSRVAAAMGSSTFMQVRGRMAVPGGFSKSQSSSGVHAVPQPTVLVRCWTSCTHLGSQQSAHAAGQAAAPPPQRQLSAPTQLPANSSFSIKRNKLIQMQSQHSVCSLAETKQHLQEGITGGGEQAPAPAGEGGTRLSPSPPQHTGTPHTESIAVLQVTESKKKPLF